MKKLKFFSCLLVASIVFAGCKNEVCKTVSEKSETEKELSEILPEQYSEIGYNHNQILSDFYFGSEGRHASSVDYKSLSVEDYFGEFDEKYCFENINFRNARSTVDDNLVTNSLLENNLITDEGAKYISKIESILSEPLDSLEETQDAISQIEIQALSNDADENLCDFFSYAETAKSSLEFWCENIETLEDSNDSNIARGAIGNWWKKYKHKIGMMAASDAAGAATGAVIGALIGTEILGPDGAAIGAIVGAIVVGAESSAEGFKKDAVCVVISLTDLRKKIASKA